METSFCILTLYKKKIMEKTLIIVLAAILLMAFVVKPRENPKNDFYNTKWMLTRLHNPTGVQEITMKKAFIKFDEERKSAGGNGSCNSFGGSFAVVGDSISISQLFSTKMYCDGVQQTEDSFFSLLQKVNRFEVKDKALVLLNGKDVLLEFESE